MCVLRSERRVGGVTSEHRSLEQTLSERQAEKLQVVFKLELPPVWLVTPTRCPRPGVGAGGLGCVHFVLQKAQACAGKAAECVRKVQNIVPTVTRSH